MRCPACQRIHVACRLCVTFGLTILGIGHTPPRSVYEESLKTSQRANDYWIAVAHFSGWKPPSRGNSVAKQPCQSECESCARAIAHVAPAPLRLPMSGTRRAADCHCLALLAERIAQIRKWI